ncbi:MAG: hypothetical protein ABIO24_05680, partial [Saprospiraceae bacterium]
SHDLAEGSVDLPLHLADDCGSAGFTVRYVLLLDLNNDGLRETVISSADFPPANTVYYGNAANPGYSGGTPRSFDERLVTAAQKYRFGLSLGLEEDVLTARVRWMNNAAVADTINPRLPAGTHRIQWLVTQGTQTKTCQYDFTVRDCYAPAVNCQPGFQVNIGPAGQATLSLAYLLATVDDNYAPTPQIQLSLREADTGAGFPLDNMGQPITQLSYDCTGLGFHLLELWAKDKAGLISQCQSYIIVEDTGFVCAPPPPVITEVCVKHFCAGKGVEGVSFGTQGGNPDTPPKPVFGNGLTGPTGCILLSVPTPPDPAAFLYAQKYDNPLNGVSTYDLVLISRHILGLESLDSPYKLIAADVNKSNSITTFDIVELRKLILGIYQELPDNTSWRFVQAAYAFPNPNNPFQTAFPEKISLPALVAGMAAADFYGIKIGDVNCSALSYSAPAEDRAITTLQVPDVDLTANTTLDIPVRMTEAGMWLGSQGSLVFDPDKLAIAAITSEKLPGWSAENRALFPGRANWS